MKLENILISMPLTDEYREQFRKALYGARVRFARWQELNDEELAGFDAVVGNPASELLPKLKGLKLLQLSSSGVAPEYLKIKELRPGAVLCSSSGAFGQAISEHMLGVLMMLLKRLHEYRDDQATAEWIDRGHVRSLRGMTVLIIGAGSIGTDFARLVKMFGARTIGVRRTQGGKDPAYDEMHTYEELDELLPEADVTALSVPETPQTVGLLDARRFSLLKRGGYLLNVGRGSVLDQDALLSSLREGRLAGAGIDVTVPEPLPRDHPMWKEKNLIITPHISGFFHLKHTHDSIVDIACRNLAAWPEGPFISRVDFASGYRTKE